MIHSEATGGQHGAEWYIWPSESISAISEIVQQGDPNSGGITDANFSETYYLDEATQQQIFLRCGYPPWRINQKPGDAVFIPPRHPHQVSSIDSHRVSSDMHDQVSNNAHSMTIACDFISCSHLQVLQQAGKDIHNFNGMLHLTRMA
jgi:hypothetical protein